MANDRQIMDETFECPYCHGTVIVEKGKDLWIFVCQLCGQVDWLFVSMSWEQVKEIWAKHYKQSYCEKLLPCTRQAIEERAKRMQSRKNDMENYELTNQKQLIDDLINAQQEKDKTYKSFTDCWDRVMHYLKCPVCHNIGARVEMIAKGNYVAECSNHSCEFNVGRGKTLAEVLTRWFRISETLSAKEAGAK